MAVINSSIGLMMLFFSQLTVSVQSGAIFEVDLLRYESLPTKCCDGFKHIHFGPLKCNECDPYFIICLKQLPSGNRNCITTTRENNIHSYDLTHGNIQPNHLSHNMDNWHGSVLVDVDIKDFDSITKDDDIDHLLYTFTGTPSPESKVVVVNGTKVDLTLGLRVYCEPNYYGNNCASHCINSSSSYCDGNGKRVCLSGFTGTDCTEEISIPTKNNVNSSTVLTKSTLPTQEFTTNGTGYHTSGQTTSAVASHHATTLEGKHTQSKQTTPVSPAGTTGYSTSNQTQSTPNSVKHSTDRLHGTSDSNSVSTVDRDVSSTTKQASLVFSTSSVKPFTNTNTQSTSHTTTNKRLKTSTYTVNITTKDVPSLTSRTSVTTSRELPASQTRKPTSDAATTVSAPSSTVSAAASNKTNLIFSTTSPVTTNVSATTEQAISPHTVVTTPSSLNHTIDISSDLPTHTTSTDVKTDISTSATPALPVVPEPVELYSCSIVINGHKAGVRDDVISVINLSLSTEKMFQPCHLLKVNGLSSTFEITDNGDDITDITYIVNYKGRVLQRFEVTQVLTSPNVSVALDNKLIAKNLTQYKSTTAMRSLQSKNQSWVKVHLPFVVVMSCVASLLLLVVVAMVVKRTRLRSLNDKEKVQRKFGETNKHRLSHSVPFDSPFSIDNPLYDFESQPQENKHSYA